MAVSSSKDIQIGNRSVGSVTIDPGLVQADNALRRPHLVVPVKVNLHNRPSDSMLALVHLSGELRLENRFSLSHSLTVDLWQGLPHRTFPQGQPDQRVNLQFPLTIRDIEAMERARHQSAPGPFHLIIHFSARMAAVFTYGELTSGLPDPFDRQLGLHSQTSLFWDTRIDDVMFEVDPTVWLRAVLPAFDRKGVRLVELTLPFAADDQHAMRLFAAAESEFTRTNYGKAVENCRAIFNSWSGRLGASNKKHVSEIVAERAGWPAGDLRTKMIDDLWQALLTLANDEHHPERSPSAASINEPDARFVLMATAVVSDYVGRLLAMPTGPILDITDVPP